MRFFRNLCFICFETPEGGSGGGAAPSVVQPPAGQGDTNGDFWGMFPNVPEDHRELLQPHLRDMQGEITRLQQAQSGFKPLTESGYAPDQLQGLVGFDQRFQANPTGVWLEMAKMLQDQGVIHESLDLEALQAIVGGEDIGEETPEVEGDLPPGVAAYIQKLEAKLDDIDNRFTQTQTRQQEAVQDRLLSNVMTKMKAALTKAGYAEEELTESRLNSFIIQHKGNIEQATQDLIAMRNGVLKGVRQPPREPLETRNGGPTAPKKPSIRDARDPFAAKRPAAANRLHRANRDAAQG